jgi:phosphatidylinositol 3-kinase
LHTTTTAATAANAPTSSAWTDSHFWQIIDPEVSRDNPVEDKHRRLIRSHRSSPYDRELKPNAKIRDELAVGFFVFLLSLPD